MGRRKFTAIDAYSQIMEATEKFGMFGTGWGVRDPEFKVILDELLVYKAILFYVNTDGKEGLIPIESSTNVYFGSGEKRKLDDDCIKKVGTDALTKGLSKLGFNADVFLGKFDDNKYVADLKEKQAGEATATLKDQLIAELGITTENARVTAIWSGNPGLKNDAEFKEAVKVANNRTAPKPEPSE